MTTDDYTPCQCEGTHPDHQHYQRTGQTIWIGCTACRENYDGADDAGLRGRCGSRGVIMHPRRGWLCQACHDAEQILPKEQP